MLQSDCDLLGPRLHELFLARQMIDKYQNGLDITGQNERSCFNRDDRNDSMRTAWSRLEQGKERQCTGQSLHCLSRSVECCAGWRTSSELRVKPLRTSELAACAASVQVISL